MRIRAMIIIQYVQPRNAMLKLSLLHHITNSWGSFCKSSTEIIFSINSDSTFILYKYKARKASIISILFEMEEEPIQLQISLDMMSKQLIRNCQTDIQMISRCIGINKFNKLFL
ncbi:hypothetical protein RF11_12245 [Thelohanellus kitauei]|uniref:Uncharacterized protein n=1 Tax=Thelohanellus kitauei TaxID=669202 RepID=A0A0C2MEQ8_THEKT|nr:hypothetical protein RF11_12245 [Thelohanellus kitauei]